MLLVFDYANIYKSLKNPNTFFKKDCRKKKLLGQPMLFVEIFYLCNDNNSKRRACYDKGNI